MFEQKEFFDNLKENYAKANDAFKTEISSIRTGKASPILLEKITIDYYGTKTPLSQAATVVAQDARLLLVKPFDKNMLKEIEKSIRNSNLGFNPVNDGVGIKVPVPTLTEERRKEIVKQLHQLSEKYKVSLRNIRRDGIDLVKLAQKDKDITEDDEKKFNDIIQKELNNFVKVLEEAAKKKESEIMEV